MSLETHISSSEDRLISGLHFNGRNTASYIVARRACTFAPSNAAAWTPRGLLRFNLADHSGWLDGNTVRLCMTITNNHATSTLSPVGISPACMLRRVRIIANGSCICEDIEEYGRVFQMFSYLLPSQRRFSNMVESWGGLTGATGTIGMPDMPDPIPANTSRQVCVQLLSPLLTQGKMLPLAMLPLTIELELADKDECFEGTGNNWTITRPRLLADCCDLDQTLQNSYAAHLLSGKSLPIYTHGLYSVRSAIPDGSSLYTLPIARGFTRLSTIYVSFYNNAGK